MEPSEARIAGDGAAARYAAALLGRLEVGVTRSDGPDEPTPATRWARSGAMALTGHRDGAPLPAPGPLAACAEGALLALRALAPDARLPEDGAALLGEHAACFGHTRNGRTSPGGHCRLLRSRDGWVAVHLARPEDVATLPALLEVDAERIDDPWRALERELPRRLSDEWVERGRWLSLPVAAAGPPAARAPDWLRVDRRGEETEARRAAPRVLDLSSLWAGPLCTSLWCLAGAPVWKVEGRRRPDGLREGNPRFFDLLNAGKQSVVLDLHEAEGRRALLRLAERADVIVEATRPRALAQLGLDAGAWLEERPGRVWLSLTGYGRHDAAPGRVAFGDDAAAAAGLAWATGADEGKPLFCSDAIADPLAGLHAAVAGIASWRRGGGALLDLALRDVAAHALAFDAPCGTTQEPAAPPRARDAAGSARPFGSDTARVLREVGVPC